MRIINSVLGDASGGRWQVVCDYSRLLSKRGHQVLLLLSSKQVPDRDTIPPGVDIKFVSSHGHYDYLAAWRLRRYLKAHQPDLAIAHCSRSTALLKRALAGTAPVMAVSHSHKVRRLLPADACIALTEDLKKRFEQAGTDKPCFVVPNMIRIDSQQLPEPRPYRQPLRLGALGRFDRVKGFDVFIDALGELKQAGREFVAVLGGAGVGQAELEARARTLGLTDRLTFPGWIDDTDTFLAGIDILCVPARSDAFGLTPLQAARAGAALVLSKAAGHQAMFEPDTEALFADIEDVPQTARQIGRLMDDPALAGRLRQAAFQRIVDCYSEPVVEEKLFKLIDNII